MTNRPFQVVCEIEPPTWPDLMHVRHQIGTLSKVADAFLIPDNHLGRATVSSVAVAHEVEAMGGRSIACLNSRDRNLLGFRAGKLSTAGRPLSGPAVTGHVTEHVPYAGHHGRSVTHQDIHTPMITRRSSHVTPPRRYGTAAALLDPGRKYPDNSSVVVSAKLASPRARADRLQRDKTPVLPSL